MWGHLSCHGGHYSIQHIIAIISHDGETCLEQRGGGRPNTPDAPNRSPSTTIVCISDSLHHKEEGDLHREDRGGMMMGFYVGGELCPTNVMATVERNMSPCQDYLFYKVPYRSILNVTSALESIQEQQVTFLVENDNQQQIYRWVRKNILLPLGRGHYTDWELRQSVEERILLKSSCAAIQENFGVPKTSLQRYLNILFPSLKCSSLKHLWYLKRLGEIRSKTVRKMIT